MTAEGTPPESNLKTWLEDSRGVLSKHKWTIFFFASAVVLSVTLLSFLQPPVYTATGTLWIDVESNILSFQDVFQLETRNLDYYKSQYRLFQSRAMATATIDKLKLDQNAHFTRGLDGTQRPNDPGRAVFREGLVQRLLKKISVSPLQDTRIVEVGFKDGDPKFAADVLNAIIDIYIDLNIQRRHVASKQASDFLSVQIDSVRTDIEGKERKLQEYSVEKNIVPLSDTETTIIQNLGDINRALTAATIERTSKEAVYNQIRNATLGDFAGASENLLIQKLREDYARLSREYAKNQETMRPDYPEMQRLKRELDTAREALESETKNLINSAYSDYMAALRKEQSLQEVFNKQRDAATELNSNSILYNSLKVEIANKKSLLEALLQRQSETDVSSRMKGVDVSNVWVIDYAVIPLEASAPKKKSNIILAIIAGVIGGIGLAFFLEFANTTVRTSKDIQTHLGLPTLGAIPSLSSRGHEKPFREKILDLLRGRRDDGGHHGRRRSDLGQQPDKAPKTESVSPGSSSRHENAKRAIEKIIALDPDSIQAENFRSIRTTMLVSSPPGKLKSILFTSALAQEGKSSIISNMAISLAQAGKRVVLVDSDLRKPRLNDIFGMSPSEGLSNYLSSHADILSLIRPTEFPDLFLVGSGPQPAHPIELLTSERMDGLAAFLRRTFDYVLFDAPPLLVVSDAIAMAPAVDGIVLVAWSRRTPLKALKQAKQKLDTHRLKCLGVILNSVDLVEQDGYYAHQYYHYYKS